MGVERLSRLVDYGVIKIIHVVLDTENVAIVR